ncbi:4a-hydroxytetrahydrobiopterin dehydratase [Vibrio panuliri]|uniref:Putative pterin-4-alpha-carbinolamine dehydratase n=1 Tax=Vibrio panuliri TaxID=1381081 RepID=A0A1Q9HRP9_9VIBR|nr:4a-hydroxytetrahydrobiopterin dehydratase [Vibrio panuliri]OLQ93521.1 4a-hydroxytetrahydrobiopterin dehydratase [Vibrio panuliri]
MLNELRCEACTPDATPMSYDEQQVMLESVQDWQVIERDGIPQLEKQFKFNNFLSAWAFANKVAELAEEEFHHPAILLEWGKVTVTWWSHSIKGLHKNDFICAAKCDLIEP